VLIVADHTTTCTMLHQQLVSWGMHSTRIDRGLRALDQLRAAAARNLPYDLAILDMPLPTMDGLALARAIKADPVLAALPLVLLASLGPRGHGKLVQEEGIGTYLTKPLRQSQLFNCLATVLGISTIPETTLLPAVVSLGTHHMVAAEHAPSRPLVLVAEDNLVNQRLAVRLLEKLGYRADVAVNGREAVQAVESTPYAAVLMDVQMPELDGFAATAAIRRREGPSRHTIIIAMTAHALTGDRDKCLAAGMDDYLSKPVQYAELQAMLARWLATPMSAA
jgi:CheY-like chemotaxis protein